MIELREKYDFVEKVETEADWITKNNKKTRKDIEMDLHNETLQIEQLIEQEFQGPHDHEDIKYELDMDFNDEDFGEDGKMDDNLE